MKQDCVLWLSDLLGSMYDLVISLWTLSSVQVSCTIFVDES